MSNINRPVYLGLSILNISKILMYGCYDYAKPKYGDNATAKVGKQTGP